MRGTDSAALASVCTEERLAELDAGNLPSDIDDILEDTGTTLDGIVDSILEDTGELGAAVGASLSADIAAVKAETALIVEDTNEMQGDLADGGRLDLLIDELTDQGDTNELLLHAIDGNVDLVVADTNELQTDLTDGGRLDNLIDSILTDTNEIQGMLPSKTYLSGSADSDGGIDAAEQNVINAQVVDALNTDTYAEPGQENPAATASLVTKIGYLYKQWRNKATNDGSTKKLFNDAGAVVDQKADVSEAAGTVTDGEWATGP